MSKKTTRTLNIVLVVLFFSLAVWLSSYISDSIAAQQIVNDFGYLGIVITAFFGGLNFIIPVPASTFVPVFISSGLTLFGIITSLVIGTSIADLLAYGVAFFGREKINIENLKFFNKLEELGKDNIYIPLLLLFLWASFVPFPNEAILIPLGLLGFRLRSLIIPFLAGNIVHNTVIVLGVSNIFPFL